MAEATQASSESIPLAIVQAWIGGPVSGGRKTVLDKTFSLITDEMHDYTYTFLQEADINENAFRLWPVMQLARDFYISRFGHDNTTFSRDHPLHGTPVRGLSSIIDMAKFEHIYEYGGIWLDINMQLLRDPHPILEEAFKYHSEAGDVLVGCHENSLYEYGDQAIQQDMSWDYPIEPEHALVHTHSRKQEQEQQVFDLGPLRPLSVGFFAATPKHPFLNATIHRILQYELRDFEEKPANQNTGPWVFGEHVDLSDQGGLYLLPSDAFYPVKWALREEVRDCEVSNCKEEFPTAYGFEHWKFGGSWLY